MSKFLTRAKGLRIKRFIYLMIKKNILISIGMSKIEKSDYIILT
jgi:hypothetical protein